MIVVDLGNFVTHCNILIFYEEGMLCNHGVAYSLIRICVRCLGLIVLTIILWIRRREHNV